MELAGRAARGCCRYLNAETVRRRLPWIVTESLDPTTTISAVARRYGLHASQLFVWRQRLAAPAAREAPGFVPVLLAEDSPVPAEAVGRMEIALGAVVVRIGADVDAAALRRVLEVVRGLP